MSHHLSEARERGFLQVLDAAVDGLERAGVAHAFIGGVASAALGRPRWTRDIDVLVRPQDATPALAALAAAGFETEETNPAWIYKAVLGSVTVDVLFKVKGDLYLDDEMLARAAPAPFQGRKVRAVAAEDLIVIKAVVHDEDTPRHWHDALAMIAAQELDWPYLLRRAQHGARRTLALLAYAQSNDLVVPDWVIRRLVERIYG